MRIRVDVAADTSSLRWEDVHGPARAVVYGLVHEQHPQLAQALHDGEWAGQRMRPLGTSVPEFRGAPRRRGVYGASADGSVWFGSPVPEIASSIVTALASRRELRWGRTRLTVRGFTVDVAPAGGGEVELATATPVVLKDGGRYLLPEEEGYTERLAHNLAHKADLLALPAPQDLRIVEAGPRRRFSVRGAPRIGACVRVRMKAEESVVQALRAWGLGLDTVQGFGWVR